MRAAAAATLALAVLTLATAAATLDATGPAEPLPAAAAGGPGESRAEDLRSRILLDRDCASRLGTNRTTLFANGTIRLRVRSAEGAEGEATDDMKLGELDRGELEAYRNRLAAIDLSETESTALSARGDWVDRCEIRLELEDRPAARFSYSRFDSLSLALSKLVGIADELAGQALARDAGSGLPPGYRPTPGDVLVRVDGELFEVVGPTADGRGTELRGVDQPLTLFVLTEELGRLFVGRAEPPPG